MSEKKFKFVSPGIFINEIDNSQLPNVSNAVGPVVIGRSQRGPGLRPVKVESFSEFVEIFGNPVPGGQGGDVWRNGNSVAPTYGPYAVQAWLRNSSPCTFVRLLGAEHVDAVTAGNAGWQTTVTDQALDVGSNGGAFGLFIVNSGSLADNSDATGSLAAVFYLDSGAVVLSGSIRASSNTTASAATLIESTDNTCTFVGEVRNSSGVVVERTRFNFSPSSELYIRKVFNTNPTLANTAITNTSQLKNYWLGETFERHLESNVNLSTKCFGYIVALASGSVKGSDFRMATQACRTGWFFSQDLSTNYADYNPSNMTNLFRIVALDTGEWEQGNLKISIQDLNVSTSEDNEYGTFSVVVRMASDSDNAIKVVERFSNCNLNPNSPNYIAKKIGDTYSTWDDRQRRYVWFGNYQNLSKFIRVEMNTDVDAGLTNPRYLPFGVYGPPRFKGFSIFSGSTTVPGTFGAQTLDSFNNSFIEASGNLPYGPTISGQFVHTEGAFTGSFEFPSIALRGSSFEGNIADPTKAYFGIDTSRNGSSTRFEDSYKDLTRSKPAGIDSFIADGITTEYPWLFTLDDLVPLTAGSTVGATYTSGSRRAGTSLTAISSSWAAVLDLDFDRFVAPMFGGFEGLNIKEAEPFRNSQFVGTETEKTSYVFNTIKRAIDSVSDPESIECNMIAAPGITYEPLTSQILQVCEDRADSLAVLDLDGDYEPRFEGLSETMGSVSSAITNLRNRVLNTSYGCAYYPWVQIRDTISDASLWVPPSIVALGAFASAEKNSELWFAVAGFTRGGLTEGAAGIPVINVRERLMVKDRDRLYEANINPIATFPAEGIVILGQKTLQITPSALDRINVRRLMNHVKKQISNMASRLLFEPNVQATWNRFRGVVEPFLFDVRTRFGLDDFKVILDETTTTADLIDRNIMYAKILLKPTKAIEYIAIDFTITNSGASFED